MGADLSQTSCCHGQLNDSNLECFVKSNEILSNKKPLFKGTHMNKPVDLPAILLHNPDMTTLRLVNPIEVPNDIFINEIKYPHQPDKIYSLSFLKAYCEAGENAKSILLADEMIDELETLREAIYQANLRYNVLNSEVLKGELRIEDYIKALKDNITRDEKLLHYYLQKKALEHFKYIKIRLDYSRKDLAEFKKKIL